MLGNFRMTAARCVGLSIITLGLAVLWYYALGQLLTWTEEGFVAGGGVLVMTALVVAHLYNYGTEAAKRDED